MRHFKTGQQACNIGVKIATFTPVNDVIKRTIGKASAIAALCLFAFLAQGQNRVLEVAPGLATFTFGRDTLDTNAMSAFFRALGCDSLCALKRTAIVLAHIEQYRDVDKLDRFLTVDLQGIGLRHYAWLRNWAIECADARSEYLDEGKKRK